MPNDNNIQTTEVAAEPISLGLEVTPEMASTRIKELLQDKDFGRRVLDSSRDSRENRLFDQLTRRSLGMEADQPVAEPRPDQLAARPAPPISVEAYVLPGMVKLDDTDDARTQFAEARTIALDHSITPGEFTAIAEQQQADAQRFGGLSSEQIEAQLDSDMQKIWGGNYDRYVANVRRYLADHPGLREKLGGLGLGRNKAVLMTLGTLAAARYGIRD